MVDDLTVDVEDELGVGVLGERALGGPDRPAEVLEAEPGHALGPGGVLLVELRQRGGGVAGPDRALVVDRVAARSARRCAGRRRRRRMWAMRQAMVVTGAGSGSGYSKSATRSPPPAACAVRASARGRMLQAPSTGSQRYSSSVSPSSIGRRWCSQCQLSWSGSWAIRSNGHGGHRREPCGPFRSAWWTRLRGVLDTSARLLRLLSLLQTRPDWSGPELADRLGVTTRTVRRDVDRLRQLGYPVDAAPGVAGGYRLGSGTNLPPLLLDDDEATAVAIALGTTTGGAVRGMEEPALAALTKLDRLLPPRLRQRVADLRAATVGMAGPADAIDSGLLVTLSQACAGQERIRMSYVDREGTPSDRRVEPYRLVSTGRRWYLVAHDVDRDDWRTFRVDRVVGARADRAPLPPRRPSRRGRAREPGHRRRAVPLHGPRAGRTRRSSRGARAGATDDGPRAGRRRRHDPHHGRR